MDDAAERSTRDRRGGCEGQLHPGNAGLPHREADALLLNRLEPLVCARPLQRALVEEQRKEVGTGFKRQHDPPLFIGPAPGHLARGSVPCDHGDIFLVGSIRPDDEAFHLGEGRGNSSPVLLKPFIEGADRNTSERFDGVLPALKAVALGVVGIHGLRADQ